jgi:MerR family transcriptional regulator/heat shock protein HspR
MVYEDQFKDEPCFVISIAARMVGLHAQTLRYYERVGLIWPSRTVGRQRLYSPADIERLRRIKTFTEDLGMNLAGAEVALKLVDRIEELEKEVQGLTAEIVCLRNQAKSGSRQ